jgi:short-subunit dehydrogenase
MDLLYFIGDLWVRRNARPEADALLAVQALQPATAITGASEGLGFALAKRLAKEGRTVIVLARTQESLAESAETLTKAYPRSRIIAAPLDAGDPSAPQTLDTLLATHGLYLDVLVNNAGVGLGGEFIDLDQNRLDELVATNVAAVTRLTRHYLPAMRARARGGILNITSLAAFVPGPWQAPYFASKAYILSLTAAIGAECAGTGVRVCALAPGPIETAIHKKMGTEDTLYRPLFPSASADRTARIAWRSYRLGRRVVVPGLFTGFLAWSARTMPLELLLQLVGWLMRPRSTPSLNAKFAEPTRSS